MIRLITLLAITSLLFSSCDKEEIDYDEKRNNIIGSWDITQVTQEIRADTLYDESSITLDITFNQDGSGTKETILGNVDFEWIYQYNPEKVLISSEQSGVLFSNVQLYSVTKNEMDRQIWEFEEISLGGVADKYKHTWKMDRK